MISDSVGESVPELTEAFLEALRRRSQVPALVDVLEPVSWQPRTCDPCCPADVLSRVHRSWQKKRCRSSSATGAGCSSTRSVWPRLRAIAQRRDGPSTPFHVSCAPSCLCGAPLCLSSAADNADRLLRLSLTPIPGRCARARGPRVSVPPDARDALTEERLAHQRQGRCRATHPLCTHQLSLSLAND